jgi:hypothetical protein
MWVYVGGYMCADGEGNGIECIYEDSRERRDKSASAWAHSCRHGDEPCRNSDDGLNCCCLFIRILSLHDLLPFHLLSWRSLVWVWSLLLIPSFNQQQRDATCKQKIISRNGNKK